MFGLGMSELVVLGVLALILIGPQQLPEVARTLGRFLNDLKRSAEGLTDDIKRQAKVDLDLEMDLDLDLLGKKKQDDKPSPPIPIMKDPRIVNTPAADQMTFTFDPIKLPEKPSEILSNNIPIAGSEANNKESEKKD